MSVGSSSTNWELVKFSISGSYSKGSESLMLLLLILEEELKLLDWLKPKL